VAVKRSAPEPAPRARNTRGQGARLRQELLEAAVRVLDRSVSADVTLRTVAQEAGVSPQAVYAHFSGRQDLNYEVVRYCWQQVAEEMARAARRARSKPAVERVRVQLRAYLRYAMRSPARYQALFGLHPELDGPDQLRVRPAEPATLELLRDVEAMYAEKSGLPLLDATECTVLLLSFVHGRVALALTAPDRSWNSLRAISLYVDQVMRGLFSQREPSGESGV
jgi:AcrR family transcriptional regulator